jgi:hypothetical protein
MTEKNTPEPTPTLLALELRGFASGVQGLATQIEIGNMKDATKEQRADAENAALALLRNAPLAIRSIRRLESFAEATAERAAKNRDKIMTSMFGPDTE